MSKISSVVFIAAISVASSAGAGEKVDETRDATANGLVEIISPRGEVSVLGWDDDRVHVEGELDDLTEAFVFEVRGNVTRIEVEIPRRSAGWGDGSDLKIRVPKGSKVRFEGVSSDSSFDDIRGGLRVRTASGDIRAEHISTMINLTTVSGDIDISDASGNAKLSSVSGDIQGELTSKTVVLDTVSGDVEVKLGEVDRLHGSVVSGDFEIEGQLMGSGEIEISSVSGLIQLDLVSPINARISAETGPGGDIDNRLSDARVKTSFPAMSGLETTIGDGSSSIVVRTVSGDIRLDSIE